MKNTDFITTEQIERLVKKANEYNIKPIRYASTQVREITSGTFKGFYFVPNGVRPRKNGKLRFYFLYINLLNEGIKRTKKIRKFDPNRNVLINAVRIKGVK